MWSENPDRSSARLLQGARMAGEMYIFAELCESAASIDFFWDSLDDEPIHSASSDPYYLNGATDSTANYLSSLVMPKGLHTLLCVGRGADGSASAPFWATATYLFPADGPDQELLLYSLVQSRRDPRPLQDALVQGTIYVFLAPGVFSQDCPEVTFYLDDPLRSAPQQIERRPPYDLGAGSTPFSKPLQTTALANGQHSVQVRIQSPSILRDLQTSFNVANP